MGSTTKRKPITSRIAQVSNNDSGGLALITAATNLEGPLIAARASPSKISPAIVLFSLSIACYSSEYEEKE
ncbi:hypothetical protein [Photobacterium damselae]|uniref:hypothetical protein n=1 Tax=Photobacterium damselae TaxID=38293 RepID=UPI001F2AE4C3|nr:hypothetical protein [Photobacterium damselae]UKA12912.1 hypothetical protein IHC91_21580 [Photobacterium damselae subsp. damselae]